MADMIMLMVPCSSWAPIGPAPVRLLHAAWCATFQENLVLIWVCGLRC